MMADTTGSLNGHIFEKISEKYSVKQLKTDLDGWKLVILPLNNVLEWEHKFDPLIIFSVVSLIFGGLFVWDPSLLTTVSSIALVVVCADFLVPLIAQSFFKPSEWTDDMESKYTRICERISHFFNHIINFKNKVVLMRKEKQSLYFLVTLIVLIFFIYVGQLVDNMLLTFFITLICSLLPGARRHKVHEKCLNHAKSLIKKAEKKPEEKKE